MRRCLEIAERGRGGTRPNPLVGSVVVSGEGEMLGEGWHATWGGPHAEVGALDAVRRRHGAIDLSQATIYVNLEPCSHHGKTPPCTDRILREGVGRVVAGSVDPNPEVDGVAHLRAEGIEVETGVEDEACNALNRAFFHLVRRGRPLVVAKTAQTLDGFVAPLEGSSRWITGEASRRRVHAMRARVDAVLVGAGTAAADDPQLTVRHVEGPNPMRLVLDGEGVLSSDLRLFSDAHAGRTVGITSEASRPAWEGPLKDRGGQVLRVPRLDRGVDLSALFGRLGKEGIPAGRPLSSVLVEPGPRLLGALLESGCVTELAAFVAPRLLGRGRPMIEGWGADTLNKALTGGAVRSERIGDDLLIQITF